MAPRLAALALRHPRSAVVALLTVSLVLAAGALRIRTQVGYRAFLGDSHPVVAEFDRFLERFGGGLPLLAVWSCEESPACDTVFDPASLAMAHSVARQLATVDGVRRVDTLATSPLVVPELIGLPRARRLAPQGTPVSDIERLAERALADPLWVGQLVSEDGTAAAIMLHLASSDGETGERVFAALRDTLAPHERSGFRFYLVGGPVEFVVAGGELERNTARILPIMVALIGLVLFALLRSLVATAAALATVGVAVLWTLGAMGWIGWPANSLTQALAPLVLVIGVCDAIHLVARYTAQPDDMAPVAALLRASEEVGPPCVMTTLTTAAGFTSLAASPLASIARFGVMAALGVLAAFVLTFTLLPLVITRLPRRRLASARMNAGWKAFLTGVSRLARCRRAALLSGTAALAGLAMWGLADLRVDASFEDLYGRDSQVVRWAGAVARVLRQPDTLELAIEPTSAAAAGSPRTFAVVDELQAQLPALDGLGRALSIIDPMRQLNAMLHRDRLVFGPREDEKGRPGSLLRLLRAEDSGLVDLFVERQSGALRITMEAEKLPQDRLRRVLAEVRGRVAAVLPDGWKATITGPLAVVQVMIDEIRTTQLRSFAIAALLVFAAVALFFRSLRYASLAMVPTLFPVLITLGAMGLAGIPLDIGSAMVAAVVLGIAVDDAIHMLAAYRRLRRAGRSPRQACDAAVLHTGRAIVTTSAALAAGFFSLMLSPWKSIASFGLVSGIAIGSAMLAALLILPALLSARKEKGRSLTC